MKDGADHVADTIRAFLSAQTVEAEGIPTDSIIGHLANAIQTARWVTVTDTEAGERRERLVARLEAVHLVLLRAANRGELVVGLVDDCVQRDEVT